MRPFAAPCFVVLFAAAAAAQSPMPYSSASRAPTEAVAASTVAVPASSAPAPIPKRPIHAVIHKEAVDWEPLSLREGGEPGAAETAVALKVVKVKGRMKGENSKAKALARVHPGPRDSRWLVITVRAKPLERRRTHLELRFRVFEGYVEEVSVAAVTVSDLRRAPTPRPLDSGSIDSFDLRAAGVEYEEEHPGSGSLVVSALDWRPAASARNSGRLEKAEFADKDLGFVNLSWSVRGVAGPK